MTASRRAPRGRAPARSRIPLPLRGPDVYTMSVSSRATTDGNDRAVQTQGGVATPEERAAICPCDRKLEVPFEWFGSSHRREGRPGMFRWLCLSSAGGFALPPHLEPDQPQDPALTEASRRTTRRLGSPEWGHIGATIGGETRGIIGKQSAKPQLGGLFSRIAPGRGRVSSGLENR
jgi:hypothetical protein